MSLDEAIYTTRAMRRLRTDPVPPELLSQIVGAATMGPSGNLMQTVPGFTAATCYRVSDAQAKGIEPRHRYLSIYEVEGDDLQGALDALLRAGRDMVISEHLDLGTAAAYLYEEITPGVVNDGQ